MSFHTRRRLPASATFYDVVTIELTGNGNGYGDSIDCEVEFLVTRPIPATYDDPAEGGECEIVAVRPFRYARRDGVVTTTRVYEPVPDWLDEMLRQCIDVDSLHVDWSDI